VNSVNSVNPVNMLNPYFVPILSSATQIVRAAHRANDAASVQLPSRWPEQGDLLTILQQMGPGVSALLILLGVVYLLFGFNLFKFVVVLNAACIGLVVGLVAADKSGIKLPVAIVCAIIAGAVTWPLMKWAVAVMGGTFGALVGVTVWRVVDLDPAYAWSGAMIGLVAFGLLCFILFRGCVMMYTSFQGSVMLIFGILGLLLKYQDLAPRLGTYLVQRPFLLPMCVFVPTVIGMMYQQAYATPKPAAGGGAPKK
jgi:hypothetical protein